MKKKKSTKKKQSEKIDKKAEKKADKKEAASKPAFTFKSSYGIAIGAVVVILLLIAFVGMQPKSDKQADTPMGEQEACGDGVCGARESASGSCPSDCQTEREYESEVTDTTEVLEEAGDCVREGGTIPVVPNAPECCSGLTLIDRKESSILGIAGICTAKCGNGVCDTETESPKNCPTDCEEIMDARPICDGVGTSKEGWYQNDKILIYAFCNGCTAECMNKGTPSEGWFNSCNGKQIKRVCN
ncbi:hypothetical protein JW826_01835 [Candidatus Woesearchaeota archaeon]|nr:hypothetical protein [Candidatus Woesearchaeota archaeon]